MAAKRFSKTAIDWAAFAERVPEYEKSKFLQFKAKADRYVKNMMSYPEKPAAIDWSMYRSRINPALVDEFEKKYSAVKVPFPADKVTPSIDQQQKESQKDMQEYVELSQLRIKINEKQLEWWKTLMPFDEMTMDDHRDYFPAYAHDFLGKPNFWPYDEPPTPVFPYRRRQDKD